MDGGGRAPRKAKAAKAPKAAKGPKAAASSAPGADELPVGLPTGMFTPQGLLALSDLLPVMTAYLDRDLRYRFMNKALADWFGRPRREMIGRTMREVLGEANYAAREPMVLAALGGERQFFAATFEHPTRGTVAAQTEYVPWRSADGGEVEGVAIVITDITEQRVTEKALRESEERFRRIANSAPAMMWVTRLDRVRDFVNDHYIDFVLGPERGREDARTVDWRTRIHPDDHDRIVAESIAGEATLAPFTLEGRYRRWDGEWRWLRSVSQPRFGPDGELVGFIGVAGDITLAKEAELELRRTVEAQTAELKKSAAQFKAVFEAALEVMVLLEPDGTVLAVNNRREIWRHPNPEESLGQKLWDAPTLQAYPQHKALMKRGIATAAAGRIFNSEVKMEREGAPTAYLDVSVQPVRDPEGQIVYLLFEARDITELKAAQEQLRQSQKMEALGQLTGGIAHDFNNLLTVVVGGLDLIAKRIEDAKLKKYAENALAAAERGARLTGQLLAFSRVQRLEARPTHVRLLIENMRPLLRNVLGPGIQKTFDLDREMLPVMADPTQLEVAVLNLAINARDAMPDGGTLHFASRKVTISGDPEVEDGEFIELSISDTGEGMSPDVLERAFEPFFTTKEVGKGTGLGLSMVYGMARQSGGTARVDSKLGDGTTIRLLFRAADADATNLDAAIGDEPEPEAERGPASVLVIDDDPDVRGFMVAALEERGFKVRAAADGTAGIQEAAKEKPDLVILDFIMPGLSGAEVAKRLLIDRGDQAILFVSGYSETEAVKRIAPDAPLLAKPFRADALEKAVRGVLSAKV